MAKAQIWGAGGRRVQTCVGGRLAEDKGGREERSLANGLLMGRILAKKRDSLLLGFSTRCTG